LSEEGPAGPSAFWKISNEINQDFSGRDLFYLKERADLNAYLLGDDDSDVEDEDFEEEVEEEEIEEEEIEEEEIEEEVEEEVEEEDVEMAND